MEIVDLLIRNGTNVNASNNLNNTALILAAENGNFQIKHCKVKFFVMELSEQIFIYLGHKEIVQLLIKSNADLDAKNKDNNTALKSAATNGNFRIES